LKKLFDRDIKSAKSKSDREEIEQNAHWELSEYEDQIDTIKSQRLVRTARRLDLSIPSGDEYWERSNWTDERFLTTAGRTKLRDDIRQEKKQKRDVIRDVLIGVSTLISILSLVNSCRKK
jgi:hypothetical protein